MRFRAQLSSLVAAVLLKTGGGAAIRPGGGGLFYIFAGLLVQGSCGWAVNGAAWDFLHRLAAAIAFLLLAGILCRRYLAGESVPLATRVGLLLMIGGGLLIPLERW